MTVKDKEEIKELITLTLKANNAEIRADYTIIDNKLDGIDDHLKRLNGSVKRHDQDISTLKISNSNKNYFWKTLGTVVTSVSISLGIIIAIIKIFGLGNNS